MRGASTTGEWNFISLHGATIVDLIPLSRDSSDAPERVHHRSRSIFVLTNDANPHQTQVVQSGKIADGHHRVSRHTIAASHHLYDYVPTVDCQAIDVLVLCWHRASFCHSYGATQIDHGKFQPSRA